MNKCHGITANKSYGPRPIEPNRKLSEMTFESNSFPQIISEPVDV